MHEWETLHPRIGQNPRVYSVKLPPVSALGDIDEAAAACSISEGRRKKISAFHFKEDKARSFFSELLLRRAMADAFQLESNRIELAESAYGKPYLVAGVGPEFNISHSGEWVCCAVCETPVGIDVERVRPMEFESILKEICRREEIIAFNLAGESERLRLFFGIWTAKESVAKCLGLGFSLPPTSIGLSIASGGNPGLSLLPGQPASDGLGLAFIELDADHVCCVASPCLQGLAASSIVSWRELLPAFPVDTEIGNGLPPVIQN